MSLIALTRKHSKRNTSKIIRFTLDCFLFFLLISMYKARKPGETKNAHEKDYLKIYQVISIKRDHNLG